MSKIKVEVVQPFERFKVGETPELTTAKAVALEKAGYVIGATKTAEKQIAKANA